MIIKREMPEKGELVMIKITKIMPHGAYCSLTEYNLDAYLPISEVASGWIKNIHEFIKEGQKDVAKVISVDPNKKTIDISLKKANQKERSDKNSDYNLEKRAEMFFEQSLKKTHNEGKKAEIITELSKKATTFNDLIVQMAENTNLLDNIKYKGFKESFYEVVLKNTKPKKYEVSYIVDLKTTDTKSGITTIKKAFESVESLGVKVLYLGAPRFRLTSEDESYPKAENKIKESQKILETYSKQFSYTIKTDKS